MSRKAARQHFARQEDLDAAAGDRLPDLPWRQIAGLPNRIVHDVHDYFGLDLEIIWHVIRHDLPQLQAKLESIAETRRHELQRARRSREKTT